MMGIMVAICKIIEKNRDIITRVLNFYVQEINFILRDSCLACDPNYDFVHGIVVPSEVAPSKVDPWTYRPIEIELGKLPRYSQPYKSVEFKFN